MATTREANQMNDSGLVAERLQELYESLSLAEKEEANAVLFSWLESEDDFRWHPAMSLIRELKMVEAVPALLKRADRFAHSAAPGGSDWAETLKKLVDTLLAYPR